VSCPAAITCGWGMRTVSLRVAETLVDSGSLPGRSASVEAATRAFCRAFCARAGMEGRMSCGYAVPLPLPCGMGTGRLGRLADATYVVH